MQIVRRFCCRELALTFPPFPPARCLNPGAWQPCAWCKHLQWRARGDGPGESPAKGHFCQGPLSDEVKGCEVTQTLKRRYSFMTVFPFIRKRACEILFLNKILQIEPCVKGAEEACYSNDFCKASFIYQRLHSFIQSTYIYIYIYVSIKEEKRK